jgi:predicted RND superfamily exporter protein
MKKLANIIVRRYKAILLLSLVLFALSIFTTSNLSILSNMEEMLPENSNTLQASKEFDSYFPSQDNGIVVVRGEAETSKQFLGELEEELMTRELKADILYQIDLQELDEQQLLYLDDDFFENLENYLKADDVANIHALITPLMDETTDENMLYITNDTETAFLMMLRPVIDRNDFLNSREDFYHTVTESIHVLLEREDYHSLDAGLTGGAFIQDIEADNEALDGFFGTMVITVILIFLIIMLTFRKTLLLSTILYPLLLGVLLAASFAYLLYGSINMFTMSFALLLIGLGIDFSIHFISRYLEARELGETTTHSVKTALHETGVGIMIGAITTSFAFLTFLFAKFKAFEQMGVISAIGIVSLCVSMIILVPAFVMLIDRKAVKQRKKIAFTGLNYLGQSIAKRPMTYLITVLVCVPLLFFSVKNIEVVGDLDKIFPDDLESVKWSEIVEDEFDYNTNTLAFMVENEEALTATIDTLEKRDDVDSILSIYDYLPDNQAYKQEVLEQLQTFLTDIGDENSDSFHVSKMEIHDLPTDVASQFIGKEGRLLVEVVPSVNIYDQGNYSSLEQAITTASGHSPVSMAAVMNEVIELVKEDIVTISIICLVTIAIVLLLLFKSVKNMLICLIPVILTLYVTLGVIPYLGGELNVFSIAAFPLIIGIGIDSSIHLVHRLKIQTDVGYVLMTTGKAIILTGITTCIGFGSLIFINHPGMANLGATVVIGMIVCLVITLTIVPALYVKLHRVTQH